jgi:hypothetical protein
MLWASFGPQTGDFKAIITHDILGQSRAMNTNHRSALRRSHGVSLSLNNSLSCATTGCVDGLRADGTLSHRYN